MGAREGRFAGVGIEDLLSRLAGVLGVNVAVDADGRIREIHVLADPRLQPKQVVRNVESALRAGLGIDVDRRIISVAQLSGTDSKGAPAGMPAPQAAPPPGPLPSSAPEKASVNGQDRGADTNRRVSAGPWPVVGAGERVILDGFESYRDASRQSRCRVRLSWRGRTIEGTGVGTTTLLGRVQAAARAVFNGIGKLPGWHTIALDGADLVDLHGRTYIVVCAGVPGLRGPHALAGAATLAGSPERAGILAALQATDRYRAPDVLGYA